MVLGIDGFVSCIDFTKIAAESVLQIVKAGLNICLGSLQKRLDRTVRKIPHKAGQVIATCSPMRRIAKTDALNPAFEDDMFGGFIHNPILESLKICRNKKGETVGSASPVISFRCL